MKRVLVQSSSIRSVGYAEGVLEIEFISGGVYAYRDVPENAYAALLAAPSLGRHVNEFVRGRFFYERIAS